MPTGPRPCSGERYLVLRIKISFGIHLLGSWEGRICTALIFFHFDPLGVASLAYTLPFYLFLPFILFSFRLKVRLVPVRLILKGDFEKKNIFINNIRKSI